MTFSLSDFDFDLPSERIAQRPATHRTDSRLLVVSPEGGVDHRRFPDLLDYLEPGDLLVLNDARVIPARLAAVRPTGGRAEILLVRPVEGEGIRWICMGSASKRLRAGSRLLFPQAPGVEAEVEEALGEGFLRVHFRGVDDPVAFAERIGQLPLPPYIRREEGPDLLDRERYQTVFARVPGAVAAPTAGLHFTEELLDQVRARGIEVAQVTLHVGPGTFLPVRAERIEEHRMHHEQYEIPPATAEAIVRTRTRGGRVMAVGTTCVRTLEAAALPGGQVRVGPGETDLFITPGYRFQIVDRLVTNFHLPKSTLMMLVAALGGYDRIMSAYREALEHGYRFYSYGDAMVIL